jgi:hypothetical protein
VVARDIIAICGKKSTSWWNMNMFNAMVHEYHKPVMAGVLRRTERNLVPKTSPKPSMAELQDEQRRGWLHVGVAAQRFFI